MANKYFSYSITLIFLIQLFSCTPKNAEVLSVEPSPTREKTEMGNNSFESYTYFVFENGQFVESQLGKKPRPVDGEIKFLTTMYRQIKYPPLARENGVSGIVLISVVLNEMGQLESSDIIKRIGSGCDEEAIKAVRKGFQLPFEAAMKNGKAVKVKFDVPVNFRLE